MSDLLTLDCLLAETDIRESPSPVRAYPTQRAILSQVHVPIAQLCRALFRLQSKGQLQLNLGTPS